MDDFFKEALEQNSVAPKGNVWLKIEAELPAHKVDLAFKEALEEHSAQPSEKVWRHVERQLPLSLPLRAQLRALSRVAAVLVAIMSATLYFNNRPAQTTDRLAQNEHGVPAITPLYKAPVPSAEALNLKAKPKPLAPKHRPSITTAVDTQVAFVLAEDGLQPDKEKIKRILQPLERLPLDAALAFNTAAPKNGTEAEKLITAQLMAAAQRDDTTDLHIAVFPVLQIGAPPAVDSAKTSNSFKIPIFPILRLVESHR